MNPLSHNGLCAVCGRHMPARKSRAQSAIYCSAGCRKRRLTARDEALETTIVALLSQRKAGATLCPSEAARAVFGDEKGLNPVAMERTRSAARRLVARDVCDITQKGHVVKDPSFARGPIRIRLRR